MKHFRNIMALLLAVVMLCGGALADTSMEYTDDIDELLEGFGSYGETPEDIILSTMEIFSWFTIWPLDVDPELCGGDGNVWRVADDTLCRYDVMMRLLGHTFSKEIVEEMMAYEVYTIIDGVLYGTSGGRPIDPNIAYVDYEQTESGDDRVVYTATVHYWDEGENGAAPDEFEFVRQQIDGRWVFTQFPFFW